MKRAAVPAATAGAPPGAAGGRYGGSRPAERGWAVLSEGSCVRVGGLQSAVQHNGREGRLVRWHAGNGRWEVDLGVGGDDHLLARPQHLEVVGALPGGCTQGGVLLSMDSMCVGPDVWASLAGRLRAKGMPVFTMEGTQFAALTRNLDRWKCIIILCIGSDSSRESVGDLLTCPALQEAMVGWVRGGGHLILHGEGFVTDVLRWFGKPWDWEGDMYCRTVHSAGENSAAVIGFRPEG